MGLEEQAIEVICIHQGTDEGDIKLRSLYEIAKSEDHDIVAVLCDYDMVKLTGAEVLGTLRASNKTIPLAIHTAMLTRKRTGEVTVISTKHANSPVINIGDKGINTTALITCLLTQYKAPEQAVTISKEYQNNNSKPKQEYSNPGGLSLAELLKQRRERRRANEEAGKDGPNSSGQGAKP